MRKIIIFILAIFLMLPFVALAEEDESFDDLEKTIQELEEKITDSQNEQRSLSSQIGFMDNQIRLTTLRIADTEKKVERLGEDIERLSGKIEVLEGSLTDLTSILIERIISTYKARRISFFSYLFSAESMGDFLRRGKYIATAQANDKRVMFEVQEAKTAYGEQKTLREDKKSQQEVLKTQLEVQKRQVDAQRGEKANILEQTKSDEQEYQRLLQQALAEKNALEAALVDGVEVGPINKGDLIALVGNTGWHPDPSLSCSTGAHLHFEVRRDNTWVNAADFLQSKTVKDDQNGGEATLGSGEWSWPLEGDIRITQFFGKTPYSWVYRYSDGIHTGIDMVSDSSTTIKAPADGVLYKYSQLCKTGGNIIKIVYIDHGSGIISFYLHVQ